MFQMISKAQRLQILIHFWNTQTDLDISKEILILTLRFLSRHLLLLAVKEK